MWWDMGFGWWGFTSGLLTLLFVAGIIIFVVWLARKPGESGGVATKSSPLDIAKERYAKGEISKEEFEQIKKDLS